LGYKKSYNVNDVANFNSYTATIGNFTATREDGFENVSVFELYKRKHNISLVKNKSITIKT